MIQRAALTAALGIRLRSVRPFSITPAFLNEEIPWYMKPEASPKLNSPLNTISQIPDLPPNSPPALKPIMQFISEELGMQDLALVDLKSSKASKNEGVSDIGDYMILSTGKSPKHIIKASSQLNFFIKNKYHRLAVTEGILRTGIIARYNRRLQRKGKKAPSYAQNDYGASPNTWVMTDCCDGIVVHFLTKERRTDLNLEELWDENYQNDSFDQSSSNNDDDIFKGIRHFHTTRKLNQAFQMDVLTLENYQNELNKICLNHLAGLNTYKDIINHLDITQMNGLQISVDQIVQCMQTLLQSTSFNKECEQKNSFEIFEFRMNTFDKLISKYKPDISDDDLVSKVMPLTLAMGSQLDHPEFSSPLNLKEKIPESPIMYSPKLNSLQILFKQKTRPGSAERQLLQITLMSIYANGFNWVEFNKIVNDAINCNDMHIIKLATILVSHLGDRSQCENFSEIIHLIPNKNGLKDYIENIAQKIST